ncbi:hypothetical protein [Nostoc sp.]
MAKYEDIAILTFVNLLHEEKSDRTNNTFAKNRVSLAFAEKS